MNIKTILILLTFISSLATAQVTTSTPGVFDRAPKISLSEENIDLGDVPLGDVINRIVTITNVGTDSLNISRAEASCGCTAALIDKLHLAPGEATKLKITYDSRGKGEGKVTKRVTVYSNAKGDEVKNIFFTVNGIKPKETQHKGDMKMLGMRGEQDIRKVFQGDCKSCHVDKGVGKLSAALYEADCAVCHGSVKEGKPAPDLRSEAMLRHDKKQLTEIISVGIHGTNMPGFANTKKVGGPLTKQEIASVVEYMCATKKEVETSKTQKSELPAEKK